ncbi:hypothetical protein GNZ11_11375 [Paraburkholderia xenovorans]|nr:hypothetical protein [Paraburkholderia xenovorans]
MIGGSEPLLAVAGLLDVFAGLALTFVDGAGFADKAGTFTPDAAGFATSDFTATLAAGG